MFKSLKNDEQPEVIIQRNYEARLDLLYGSFWNFGNGHIQTLHNKVQRMSCICTIHKLYVPISYGKIFHISVQKKITVKIFGMPLAYQNIIIRNPLILIANISFTISALVNLKGRRRDTLNITNYNYIINHYIPTI